MSSLPPDAAAKIKSLQEVTGVRSDTQCEQVLAAHGWDLNEAVSFLLAFSGEEDNPLDSTNPSAPPQPLVPPVSHLNGTSTAGGPFGSSSSLRSRAGTFGDQRAGLNRGAATGADRRLDMSGGAEPRLGATGSVASTSTSPRNPQDASASVSPGGYPAGPAGPVTRGSRHPGGGGGRPSFLAKLVSFPLWLVRGGLGAVAGAVALSLWAAGGVFSFFISRLGALAYWASGGALGVPPGRAGVPRRAVTLPEAAVFRQRFEAEYGSVHPEFFPGSFQEALRRAGEQFRFLLVYLHAPEHVDTPRFCRDTLCNSGFVQFVDDNFVTWGGDLRGSEGFQMSGRLRASSFPFCAVLTSAGSQRIHLLRSVEGPLGPVELTAVLQKVMEDQGAVLVAARADEEERQLNRRLREEQDAAYQEALLADQEKERKRQDEERKRKEEEEEAMRLQKEEEDRVAAAATAAEQAKQLIERRRKEAQEALAPQPEKGPGVTQVVIRLPGGDRKERRFQSSSQVQALYDFTDSEALGTPCIPHAHYSLVSNFPRTVYGRSLRGKTLQEVGLHPQASLFVQMEDEGEGADSGAGGAGREGEGAGVELRGARHGKREVQ